MEQISKAMKKISFVFSIGAISMLMLILASCGGSDPSPTTTKKGSWDKKADFGGITRGNAVGFVIDNKAYVVGGYNADGNNRLKDMWQYDAAANSWIKKADFPGTARSQAVAFVIGGKGYVGTGLDDVSNRLKDFYEYNPANNQWTKIADFADGTTFGARYGCVAFSVNNRGFVGAGYNGNAQSDLWEYLPGTNTWAQRASLSAKRVNAAAFVIDNAAYVIGGTNNNTSVRNVEKYVPAADAAGAWEQKAQLTQRDKNGNSIAQPISRDFAGTFTIDGLGYITTGSVGGATFGDTWQYNPTTDVWVEYYSLSKEASQRDGSVTFAIGNFGYITTGRSGNLRFDDTWVFDPLGDEGTNGNGL